MTSTLSWALGVTSSTVTAPSSWWTPGLNSRYGALYSLHILNTDLTLRTWGTLRFFWGISKDDPFFFHQKMLIQTLAEIMSGYHKKIGTPIKHTE